MFDDDDYLHIPPPKHPRLGLDPPAYNWRRLAYVLAGLAIVCSVAYLVLKP